jgi:hypothetical protein
MNTESEANHYTTVFLGNFPFCLSQVDLSSLLISFARLQRSTSIRIMDQTNTEDQQSSIKNFGFEINDAHIHRRSAKMGLVRLLLLLGRRDKKYN